MFSTINKLIWVVAFVPFIQAQVNEFTFLDQEKTYNVHENQDITLICNPPNTNYIRYIAEVDIFQEKTIIVSNSTPRKGYTDEYEFTPLNNTFVIKNINRTKSGYTYVCSAGDAEQNITLKVLHIVDYPTCTTTATSRSTILSCESKLADPTVYMLIYSANRSYTPYTQVETETHLTQNVAIRGVNISVDGIICHTFQYISTDNGMRNKYSHRCAFAYSGEGEYISPSSTQVPPWPAAEPAVVTTSTPQSSASLPIPAVITLSVSLIISVFN